MEERRAPVRRHARGARTLSAALLLAVSATALADCPPRPADGVRLLGAGVVATWRLDGTGDAVPLAQPFALIVTLCPAQAELLAVDATMPAHRHGMNYRPGVQALGAGRWRVEGLLWHMPGDWVLRLDVRLAGKAQVLTQTVSLR